MMVTKFIIQMTMLCRPDLEYFYAGQNKDGCPVFELKKAKSKRYNSVEEADRAMRILSAVSKGQTFKVSTVRCRA
jgi:hypothetical protein